MSTAISLFAIVAGSLPSTEPTVDPPPEWVAAIARADYLFTADDDRRIKGNIKATIGNGQLATQLDAKELYPVYKVSQPPP